MDILIDKSNIYSRLVSPRIDKNRPIYNWHSFKHSYSKDLVDLLLDEFKLDENSKILDLFCGGGTTLLAAKERNIKTVGYDISPFAVFLTRVKLSNYDKKILNYYLNKIIKKLRDYVPSENIQFPEIPLLEKAYTKKIWYEINYVKKIISQIKTKREKDFFFLALLSILESVSNTSKAGGFLRIVKRNIKPNRVIEEFINQSEKMLREVSTKRRSKSVVKIGDARKLDVNDLFDAVITSPPYPNRHDYTRIYSLELILLFTKDNDELKRLRYSTLRSHVEAKHKYQSIGYMQPELLRKALLKIKNNGVNNSQILEMLKGYFEDMYLSLREIHRVLKPNGKVALVVSNVRFSGVNVLVDEILASIGEQVGLNTLEIRIIRNRGNSSQQMKIYSKRSSRESIILWEKLN